MSQPKVDWSEVAHSVLLSRALDNLEESQLTPQGKVKYQFSARGHELAQVLLASALNHPHDAAAVYYRSRPFMLAAGLSAVEALAAGMALTGSPSEGRDVGVVFNMPARTGPAVLPASGDVGAQYTPAAGWAQAVQYRSQVLQEKEWDGALAAALGGDGSTAANGFWAALNMVTTLKLPMLFFIEDNQFGLSVPVHLQTPGGNISRNLSSFEDLEVIHGDGTDPEEAWAKITKAVRHIRRGKGPCLLHLHVPRLAGHTFIDDQAYKSPETLEEEAKRDPLPRLQAYLLSQGMEADEWQRLQDQAEEQVRQAAREVEDCPPPTPEEIRRFIFSEGVPSLQGSDREISGSPVDCEDQPQPKGPRMNFIDAVRKTLEIEMSRDPRLLVFGEDVGIKGGVHGATLDMQAHFGPERVFDTSLSEDAIIGRAVGMALAGLRPVPEIQFRKYADPATEQINDLGTLRWRTANHFSAPVVVRIPVGFGKKTGDPWHSVTGEAIYAHTLGWRVAFPSNARDAVGLLRTALRGNDPTFFFEHRALLDTAEGRRPYPGDDYCLPFGKAALIAEGSDCTVVTWGAMTARCQEAILPFSGRVQLLDLRTIIPWDRDRVLESVQQTGKLLIVHEDTLTNGFGAEIAATVASEAFTDLDAPVRRLAMPDLPVPFNLGVMELLLPSVESIRNEVASLLDF